MCGGGPPMGWRRLEYTAGKEEVRRWFERGTRVLQICAQISRSVRVKREEKQDSNSGEKVIVAFSEKMG